MAEKKFRIVPKKVRLADGIRESVIPFKHEKLKKHDGEEGFNVLGFYSHQRRAKPGRTYDEGVYHVVNASCVIRHTYIPLGGCPSVSFRFVAKDEREIQRAKSRLQQLAGAVLPD